MRTSFCVTGAELRMPQEHFLVAGAMLLKVKSTSHVPQWTGRQMCGVFLRLACAVQTFMLLMQFAVESLTLLAQPSADLVLVGSLSPSRTAHVDRGLARVLLRELSRDLKGSCTSLLKGPHVEFLHKDLA